MGENDLKEKFPDMEPVVKAPLLHTVNGFGVSLYGHRDPDRETRTFVKTYCISVLFVPLIALRAYRVASAQGGWYFIGRVPLSGFAKLWNLCLLSTVVVLSGYAAWQAHTQSPDYVAAQQLAEADDLRSSGKLLPAARKYRIVINSGTPHAAGAHAGLQRLLDEQLAKSSPADAAGILSIAAEVQAPPGRANKGKLYGQGMALIEALKDTDPRGALTVLDAVAPLAGDAETVARLRANLLEQAVAKAPDDPELASQLALLLEKRRDFARCEALLTPHLKRLGTAEGARILGQIFARNEKLEEAFALLSPYAEGRLQQLHSAEKEYELAVKRIERAVHENLNGGRAPQQFYRGFDKLSQPEQEAQVQAYFQTLMKNDPGVKAAQDALARAAAIVPVALDLGIVRLRRAQNMRDPAARSKELEAAEKLFLAIRGLASETDEYRLFYGQVCYWLDKHEEGRKLFDELLSRHQRSGQMLLAVAELLREVGAHSEARTLSEEAYQKESDPQKKQHAARIRALMQIDVADQIKWLRLSNVSDPETEAALHAALSHQALLDGKRDEAAESARKAIAGYLKLPKSATSLNNAALACFTLAHVTGARADQRQALDLLGEAVTLAPSDSVLLANYAFGLLQNAMQDTIGDALDLKRLETSANWDLLGHLYADDAGRQQTMRRLQAHPDFARAQTCFERLLVLAPKNEDAYWSLLKIHRATRHVEALHALQKRLQTVKLDLVDALQQAQDHYQGKKDAELRKNYDTFNQPNEKVLAAEVTDKKTLAAAAAAWVENRISAQVLGAEIDADKLVQCAERGYAASESAETRSVLTAALFLRAGQTLARQDPAFAALAKKVRRSLSGEAVIAYALNADKTGALRDKILQDPDVKRALELVKRAGAAFPDARQPCDWALFKAADPAEAEKVSASIQQNEAFRIAREIDLILWPMSATVALDAYFVHLMGGNEAQGKQVLDDCAKRGVPLP